MDEKIPTALRTFYSPPNPRSSDHDFLYGIRGLVTIGTFLYTFLVVFLPGSVVGLPTPVPADQTPLYALVLRYTLAVLFWNGPLLYSLAILLSARTISLPFLLSSPPDRASLASSIFRRPFRIAFAIAVPLAITTAMAHGFGTDYIQNFLTRTNNTSATVPYTIPNALAYFNSLLALLAVNKNYTQQAGSLAMPGGTAWVLSTLYQQSMTVYMTQVIIPYTHRAFRVKALLGFILTAWWVQSWAWYSITGLLIADAVITMDYRNSFDRGVPISVFPELLRVPLLNKIVRREEKRGAVIRIPSWILCACLMVAGMIMQYVWTDWRPDDRNVELTGHTAEYYSGGLNTDVNPDAPQARDDNYVLIVGFLLLVEGSKRLRACFNWSFLRYLGDRSLSYFLTQSIIIYGGGIRLYMALVDGRGVASEAAVGICFVVCAAATMLAAEIFHRVFDQPSRVLPHKMFAWLTS